MIANQVIEECDSTNTLAKELGEAGFPSGTWISAKKQNQGRGRSGRTWVSEEGNLFLSVILRPSSQVPITWIPLRVAVVLLEAIQTLNPDLKMKIKWPNDLVSPQGEKYAGILCEGYGGSQQSFLVVGIGVNCSTSPLTDRETACVGVSADKLRALILKNIESVLEESDFKDRFQKNHVLHEGQKLGWVSLQNPELILNGTYKGLGEFGELIVTKMNDQSETRLWSEEVRTKI